MRKRVVSLFISAVMLVTVFSVPFTAVADTTGTSPESSESEITLLDGEQGDQSGEGESDEPEITEPIDISDANITLPKSSYEYTGSEIVPTVTVELNGATLVKEQDYTVTVSNNTYIGNAKVIVEGKDKYMGSVTKTFTITRANISKASVTTQYSSYSFAKKYIKPKTTVKLNGKTLVYGTDYSISYKNNYYPGTGTVVITGKGNYYGTYNKSFYIARGQGLKVVARGTNYVTLSWTKNNWMTGYKLYKYSFDKEKWVLYKTIKGNKNTSCKVTGLGSGYGYDFKVRPYYTKGLNTYYGEYSAVLKTPARPLKAKIKGVTQDARLMMTVKWNQVRGSGYQVRLSRSSSFSDYTTYIVKGSSTTSRLFQKLGDQRTYYLKVRAYRTYGGITTYGAWSDVYKTKASDTGWVYKDGFKYYYQDGVIFKGTKKISGSQYYFDSNGIMRGGSSTMWSKVKDQTSYTKYLIAVSRDMNRVMVYSGKKGDWKPLYYWKCTDGAKATKTPSGSFLTPKTTPKKRYIGGHITYTCWYATRVYKSIYFHSVLYNPRSKTSIQDGRLGVSASHGCIRLSLDNAKWLYDNIQPQTRVIVY